MEDNKIPNQTNNQSQFTSQSESSPPSSSQNKKNGSLKILIPIILVLFFIVFLAAASIHYGWHSYVLKFFPQEEKACTLEAKVCPDGSSVGRTGPNCEFAPCPSLNPEPTANPVFQNKSSCIRAGCNSELCVSIDNSLQIAATCQYRAEYACYDDAKCEVQSDGECGWTQTASLTQCILDNRVETSL